VVGTQNQNPTTNLNIPLNNKIKRTNLQIPRRMCSPKSVVLDDFFVIPNSNQSWGGNRLVRHINELNQLFAIKTNSLTIVRWITLKQIKYNKNANLFNDHQKTSKNAKQGIISMDLVVKKEGNL